MSMDADRWLLHFRHNRESRPEPDWRAPITLPAHVVRPLVRSLEQFQLGDGGGPASLIAFDAERFRGSSEATRQLVDLWFAEEKEHSRLLGAAVARFGGTPIKGHWSFTAFCLCRRWFGVRFELSVLLLTEIASTGYYRVMRRHVDDGPLRDMCRLILRDEAGHIVFHRDRHARQGSTHNSCYGRLWEVRFRLLGLAAATMLWVNHPCTGDPGFGRERRRVLPRGVSASFRVSSVGSVGTCGWKSTRQSRAGGFLKLPRRWHNQTLLGTCHSERGSDLASCAVHVSSICGQPALALKLR